MDRKLKQEQKRQRRLEKNKPVEDPENPQDENQDRQAPEDEPVDGSDIS